MLYLPKDISNIDYEKEIGEPGEFPFTRGIYKTMYTGRLWTMRQYAGYGTAEETNRRYKYLLEKGQTGLSVAFDLPTQMGYDSNHPMAKGEVGKTGVAIDSLKDMEILFADIPLGKVSTSMTINATAAIILAMYIAVAEKQGVKKENLAGTVQNDILKEYIARGTYIFPSQQSMKLVIDVIEYCSKYLPKWHPISISGYHIREAGATAVQEIAFTIANGIAYVEETIKRGIDVDYFAPRISFFFNAHNNLLEEVAKFRAARKIWAKIMKERFNAKNLNSCMLKFHTQTGGSTLTMQQPENNIIRVTLQALSAILGGTQSLHTNSADEAIGLPTEESVKIALRTQQIIAYESGIPDVIDPLAGSYCIESLTKKLEEESMEYIKKIDEMGGAIEAIKNRFYQNEIQRSAYKYQKEIEEGKKIVVGVNKFKEQEDKNKLNLLKVDEKFEQSQIANLEKIKKTRDNDKVAKSIDKLKNKAKTNENLFPYIYDCVISYVTIGEICSALKEVFGEYEEKISF